MTKELTIKKLLCFPITKLFSVNHYSLKLPRPTLSLLCFDHSWIYLAFVDTTIQQMWIDKTMKNLLNKECSQYFHDSSQNPLVALTSVHVGVFTCYSTPILPKIKTELSNNKMLHEWYYFWEVTFQKKKIKKYIKISQTWSSGIREEMAPSTDQHIH